MSHNLLLTFLNPSITKSSSFTTYSDFLFRRTWQSLLQSCPSDINYELCKFDNIAVAVAFVDRLLCNGSLPRAVDVIVALFGRVTVGPGACSMFCKQRLSCSR